MTEDHSVVLFVDFVGAKDGRPDKGELEGVTVDGELVARPEGETEPEFVERMRAEYRRPGVCTILFMKRGRLDDPA